jgi:ubiquitin C-terminal hydrolase
LRGENQHFIPTYDIVGVTNHSGSIHSGHYIAHVEINNAKQKSVEGKWKCFNDERVYKPRKKRREAEK